MIGQNAGVFDDGVATFFIYTEGALLKCTGENDVQFFKSFTLDNNNSWPNIIVD